MFLIFMSFHIFCCFMYVLLCIQKSSAAEQPTWGVLRDDFMLGADMKDWDKEKDESDENEDDEDSGLSSDSD